MVVTLTSNEFWARRSGSDTLKYGKAFKQSQWSSGLSRSGTKAKVAEKLKDRGAFLAKGQRA